MPNANASASIVTWRLDSPAQTLVLSSENNQLPVVRYWGAFLPLSENLDVLTRASRMDVTGGMLDENPDLSICPQVASSFQGQAGLVLRTQQGEHIFPKFRMLNQEMEKDLIILRYQDEKLGIIYEARFEAFPDTGIIKAIAWVESKRKIYVDWLSAPVMPAPQNSDEMIDFSGRWLGEFQLERTPWHAGIRMRDNRTGRTGHEHFPAVILPLTCATNTQGESYALHYAWSGGHKMIAEELPDGRRQVQFGHAQNTQMKAGKAFTTAPLYLAYSQTGFNGHATIFQNHLRRHIVKSPDKERPRPVHYNCWEAIYYDHNIDELKEIARLASDIGAERFVLDDGWFGSRNDDSTSLGDWDINLKKYPDGFAPLVDYIHELGMSFGIWFELEMLNPDSKLYHAHPDWILGDEDQVLGRSQMVLDMSRSEVRDYLFEKASKILTAYNVDYIKWDHNRVLPIADAAQAKGAYELMYRLRRAFPMLEIESCASGGGRIDYSILELTQRVWLSDSNDALERVKIQHASALFLPSSVTGSHVGPALSHTSGRIHSMSFRAWVAAQRHMGFECHPRDITKAERTALMRVIKWWKDNRKWLMEANILLLDSADPEVMCEQHMSNDGNQFVVFANKMDASKQILARPIRFVQLEANASYRVELVNKEDIPKLSRAKVSIAHNPLVLTGQYLMRSGVQLPYSFPASVWVIKGEKQ